MYSRRAVDCSICFDHSFVRRVMLQRAMEFLKAARTSLPVSDPNTLCSQLVLVGGLSVQLNAKSCQVMPSHAKSLLNKSASDFHCGC